MIHKRAARRELRSLTPSGEDDRPKAFNISIRLPDDLAFGMNRLKAEGSSNSRIVQQALRFWFVMLDAARLSDRVIEEHKEVRAETAWRVKQLEEMGGNAAAAREKMSAVEKLLKLVNAEPQLAQFIPGFNPGQTEQKRREILVKQYVRNERIKERQEETSYQLIVHDGEGKKLEGKKARAFLEDFLEKNIEALSDNPSSED